MKHILLSRIGAFSDTNDISKVGICTIKRTMCGKVNVSATQQCLKNIFTKTKLC